MKAFALLITTLTFATLAQAQHRTRTHKNTNTSSSSSSAFSSYSFASNVEHEVVLSPTKVSIESYKDSKSRTNINIYGAYNHFFQDQMQIGGEGGLISTLDSKGDTKTLIAAMGVFTYNFDSNLRDAFFVQGGLGLYPAYVKDNAEYNSKISFFAGGGKRFEVWGKLNYMPYARIWKRGDENVRFDVELMNFSIFY